MPRSSTTVGDLNDVAGQTGAKAKGGPSALIPRSPPLKDAFDKFEQDFQAAHLLEGKYIKSDSHF